jgi:hypothetical protein
MQCNVYAQCKIYYIGDTLGPQGPRSAFGAPGYPDSNPPFAGTKGKPKPKPKPANPNPGRVVHGMPLSPIALLIIEPLGLSFVLSASA